MKLYETMFYFISGHGRGWAFSSRDLSLKFGRQEIDNTLSDLAQKGKIRRVARGIYDYPKYSDLLSKNLSPDVDQVANAYARKFNWQIEASGDSALNILGLSTQIPAKYIYLSSGSNKSYELCDGINLEFKKSALKNEIKSGIHVVSPEVNQLKAAINSGYEFIAYSTDALLLYERCINDLKSISSLRIK